MRVTRVASRLTGMAVMVAMCATPVAATAATTAAQPSLAPIVALSMLASDASRTALCGAAGSAAIGAAGAAAVATTATTAVQPAPQPGCVLPAVDPVPVAQPVAVQAAPGGRSFVGPLLAGLAGLAFVLALIHLLGDDDEDAPASPS